jgi:ketosteroid isomerase-like protein
MSNARSIPIESMYFAWDDALSRNDAAGLLPLYAPDAVFESLLVLHLSEGACCASASS